MRRHHYGRQPPLGEGERSAETRRTSRRTSRDVEEYRATRARARYQASDRLHVLDGELESRTCGSFVSHGPVSRIHTKRDEGFGRRGSPYTLRGAAGPILGRFRSEEHTPELPSQFHLL